MCPIENCAWEPPGVELATMIELLRVFVLYYQISLKELEMRDIFELQKSEGVGKLRVRLNLEFWSALAEGLGYCGLLILER